MTAENGERCGVIVLGMHRGGTSLVSHLLGEMGLSHGGELMEPRFDNPLGYWEHAGVVEIHDDFLADLERDWQDPAPFSAADFATPAATRARQRIREVFEADFAPRERWVLKDPRHCRLLPLWDEIFAERRQEIRFLHVLRHPETVARSMAAREAAAGVRSDLLWLRHQLESERFTRGWRRSWIDFDALTDDPAGVISGACEALGLGPLVAAADEDLFDRVLDRSRVHHRLDAQPELHPWIDKTFTALLGLITDPSSTLEGELDHVRAELAVADGLFGPVLLQQTRRWRQERREWDECVLDASRYARLIEQALDEKTAHAQSLEKYAQDLEKHTQSLEKYTRSLEEAVTERDRIITEKDRQSAEATAYTRDLERRFSAAIS